MARTMKGGKRKFTGIGLFNSDLIFDKEENMNTKKVSIFLATILTLSLLLSACSQPVATQVINQVVTEQLNVEKVVTATPIVYGDVVWLSTQFNAINEAEAIRGVVLKGFPAKVEFVPDDAGAF